MQAAAGSMQPSHPAHNFLRFRHRQASQRPAAPPACVRRIELSYMHSNCAGTGCCGDGALVMS